MRFKNLSQYAQYIALGTHIAASMIIPVVIGIYVDNRWNTAPWGVVIGALLGFGALISIVLKLAMKTGETEYKKRNNRSGDSKI